MRRIKALLVLGVLALTIPAVTLAEVQIGIPNEGDTVTVPEDSNGVLKWPSAENYKLRVWPGAPSQVGDDVQAYAEIDPDGNANHTRIVRISLGERISGNDYFIHEVTDYNFGGNQGGSREGYFGNIEQGCVPGANVEYATIVTVWNDNAPENAKTTRGANVTLPTDC